jgi:hypothetical protein
MIKRVHIKADLFGWALAVPTPSLHESSSAHSVKKWSFQLFPSCYFYIVRAAPPMLGIWAFNSISQIQDGPPIIYYFSSPTCKQENFVKKSALYQFAFSLHQEVV